MNQVPQQLPPFRLYGLIGCPHCAQAEAFLRSRLLPSLVIVANGDPIAEAGIKSVTGKEQAEYPVLCCTLNNKIVMGFKEAEYDELSKLYHTMASAGVFGPVAGLSDGAGGELKPSPEAAPASTEATSGPN